jgi:hypothetical protein
MVRGWRWVSRSRGGGESVDGERAAGRSRESARGPNGEGQRIDGDRAGGSMARGWRVDGVRLGEGMGLCMF